MQVFPPHSVQKKILKGECGCSNGDKCRFTHPRLCVGTLVLERKKCFLSHVTGSSRPNLPKNIGVNEKLKASHVQERIHLTSKPTTSIDSPKQTYADSDLIFRRTLLGYDAEVVNGGSSFLEQLNEMQRQIMQCVFPQMWSTTQNQDKQNWAHLPGQPMHAKFAHPRTLW